MTIIAAVHDRKKRRTWIASDRRVTADSSWTMDITPKWVVAGTWAIGQAGHLRALNLLQAKFASLLDPKDDIYDLTSKLREILREDGFKSSSVQVENYGQDFLIANAKGVWAVGCDFSWYAVKPGDLAVAGSGDQAASGAAHVLQAVGKSLASLESMRALVAAACAVDAGCGGAPWVHCLEDRHGAA